MILDTTGGEMLSEKKTYSLDLCFKGARNYLHGSDIIPAVLALSGPAEKISFQIHRMASHPLLARWVNEQELEKFRQTLQICMLMVYVDERHEKKTIAVFEDDQNQITTRIPYKEEHITESSYVSGKKIIQEMPNNGSFIERIIALNKLLIQQVETSHDLVLMRLDLQRMPVNPYRISIELTRVIAEQTFISVLMGDDERLGNIYFAKRP